MTENRPIIARNDPLEDCTQNDIRMGILTHFKSDEPIFMSFTKSDLVALYHELKQKNLVMSELLGALNGNKA